MRRRLLLSYTCAAALLVAAAHGQQRTPTVDAFAQVQALNAQLLAGHSATLVLETWCRDHHLADEPRVAAHLVSSVEKPATVDQRRRLEVADRDDVKFRHVQLTCGSRVLSEADNWYVPARLTPDMNRQLERSDTPFGKAVASLEPTRETFSVRLLWSDSSTPMPGALFEHRALLFTRDHRPFSEVDEVYQRGLFDPTR